MTLNCHDELVEALKNTFDYLIPDLIEDATAYGDFGRIAQIKVCEVAARSALAKAKGEA